MHWKILFINSKALPSQVKIEIISADKPKNNLTILMKLLLITMQMMQYMFNSYNYYTSSYLINKYKATWHLVYHATKFERLFLLLKNNFFIPIFFIFGEVKSWLRNQLLINKIEQKFQSNIGKNTDNVFLLEK